jgi:hypothetical protein
MDTQTLAALRAVVGREEQRVADQRIVDLEAQVASLQRHLYTLRQTLAGVVLMTAEDFQELVDVNTYAYEVAEGLVHVLNNDAELTVELRSLAAAYETDTHHVDILMQTIEDERNTSDLETDSEDDVDM